MSEEKLDEALDAITEAGGFKGIGEAKNNQDPNREGDTPAAPDKPEQAPNGAEAYEGKEQDAEDGGEDKEPAPEVDPLDEPIKDFSKVDLGLGEDSGCDPKAVESFGKQAVELGLTPRQAAALAKWQMDTISKYREAMMEEGLKVLNKEWGKDFEANKQRCVALVKRIDQITGSDDFSRAIAQTGVDQFVGFAKGLYALSQISGEDRVGNGTSDATPPKVETALDGLKDVFLKARG